MATKKRYAANSAGYDIVNGEEWYGTFEYDTTKKETVFNAAGRSIKIGEIFKDEDGNTLVRIDYIDADKSEQSLVIDRSLLGDKKELLKKLLQAGAMVYDWSIGILTKCFALVEAHTDQISRCHAKTGWSKAGESFAYRGQSLISNDEVTSTYVGIYDLNHQGTFDDWLKMVEEQVMGWIPMEVALLIGLSPLVSNLIEDCRLIFHLMGDSSVGKTTAGVLAVSVAGCPRPSESAKRNNLKEESLHSLLTSWNGTDNAILGMLNGLDGTIIVLDELSKLSDKAELTKILYTFSDGMDKNRQKKARVMDKTDVYHTNVLSIGEESLIGKARNANTGIRMRVCEIRDRFTETAAQSEAIKKGCYANYGHAVPKMAEYMVKMGRDNILSVYDRQFESFHTELSSVGSVSVSSHRLAVFGAVILTTAEIASDALDLSFSMENIRKFMLKHLVGDGSSRNVAERAHEALWSYVTQYQAHFIEGNAVVWGKNIDCRGRITDSRKCKGKEVAFKREVLSNILRDLGFNNVDVILDTFETKGWTNHEKGKNYNRRKITAMDSESAQAIVVVFPYA